MTLSGSQMLSSFMSAIFPVVPLTPKVLPPSWVCFARNSVKVLIVLAPQFWDRVRGITSRAYGKNYLINIISHWLRRWLMQIIPFQRSLKDKHKARFISKLLSRDYPIGWHYRIFWNFFDDFLHLVQNFLKCFFVDFSQYFE